MTTNMEMSNVEMNKDNDEESELIMLQKIMEFHRISMENQEKLIGYYKDVVATRDKTFNIIFHFSSTLLLLLQNKYNNLPEAVLEIPYTSFDQYTTEKIKELEGELAIGKQTLDPFYSVDQDYMATIAKMFCKKDISVKDDQDKNSKNQTIKQEECESNMHIFVYKVILMQTEMKWWMEKVINLNLEIKDCQQYYENAQNKLKAMLIEKHETEIELLNLTTKVSKLRTLCIPCKKEKINLLLQLINDETPETESLTATASKKSILQKQMQQLTLNINSISSNVQKKNTLKKQSKKQILKDSDKDNITLPSVTRRQEIMEEENYHITLLTTNTETDDAMELLKQINNSLNKLLQKFKDKKTKSNKYSCTMTLLKDFIRKYENESTLLEEQIQALTKDFNKSDKADKTPEQIDKNFLIEWLTESLTEENLYQTLNEEIEITELLENIDMNDKSIVR